MSNTKHTPGPWLAPGTPADKYVWASKDNTTIVVTKINAQDSANPKVTISEEEALANAKLIAAAPELLEVAEAALPMYELIAKYMPQYYSAVEHERAKAAIKKATDE